jgi:hypothetical protein
MTLSPFKTVIEDSLIIPERGPAINDVSAQERDVCLIMNGGGAFQAFTEPGL